MEYKDFTATILENQTPEETFDAINNIRSWWTENMEGNAQKGGDEFTVHFDDVHVSSQRLTELVPGKKIVWLVTDSRLSFIKNKKEWTGTMIHFDITEQGEKTQVKFTHIGLVPEIECYTDCTKGWGYYINESLFKLLNEGKGMPHKIKHNKDQTKPAGSLSNS